MQKGSKFRHRRGQKCLQVWGLRTPLLRGCCPLPNSLRLPLSGEPSYLPHRSEVPSLQLACLQRSLPGRGQNDAPRSLRPHWRTSYPPAVCPGVLHATKGAVPPHRGPAHHVGSSFATWGFHAPRPCHANHETVLPTTREYCTL